MRAGRAPRSARVAIVVAALGLAPRVIAQAPPPDAVESSGVVQLKEEKFLKIVGVRGEILLRTGDAGEIQFTSVKASDRSTELPAAVWFLDSGVTVGVPEGQDNPARVLDVSLPPGLEVRVDTEGASILGGALNGNLSFKGPRVSVDLRGLNGNVSIDTSAAKVRVDGINGNATIRASDTQIAVDGVHGQLTVRAVRGTMTIVSVQALEAELDTVTAKLEGIADPVQLRAKGGTLALTLARRGGDARLAGTTLRLDRCEGTLTVQSNAAAEFKDCKADLRFELEAATLKGERNTGSVEVRSSGAAVALSSLSGPTRVEGDNLKLELTRLVGDLTVKASDSAVSVVDVSGGVDVDIDGGDVSLDQAPGEIKVKSRRGDVSVTQASSPVHVEADGEHVEISWLSLAFSGKSEIRNAHGGVVVRFPPNGSARIEAESQFAEVESEFSKLVVSPDRHKAQGSVGGVAQTVVTIVAGGVVQILGGESEPSPPAEESN
jgi:DUF4097 and DUF4098 domain-containing protein YvlB